MTFITRPVQQSFRVHNTGIAKKKKGWNHCFSASKAIVICCSPLIIVGNFLYWTTGMLKDDTIPQMNVKTTHQPNSAVQFEEEYYGPRVLIDSGYVDIATGGPEALIQLTMAFHSFLPSKTYWYPYKEKETDLSGPHPEKFHSYFVTDYREGMAIPYIPKDQLVKGDILIIPQPVRRCPQELVENGVLVYLWVLGADDFKNNTEDAMMGCKHLAHNFWLSQNLGVNATQEHVLRPYLTPSLLPAPPSSWLSKIISAMRTKKNLILIDNDTPVQVQDAIRNHCKVLACEAFVVNGVPRKELPALYRQAKVVVDWCLVGSERMPLESVLYGAILVTSDCWCAKDKRDFPIPDRNIVMDHGQSLKDVLKRILTHYQKEYDDYKELRDLYRSLNATSLAHEAKSFYASVVTSQKEIEQKPPVVDGGTSLRQNRRL